MKSSEFDSPVSSSLIGKRVQGFFEAILISLVTFAYDLKCISLSEDSALDCDPGPNVVIFWGC